MSSDIPPIRTATSPVSVTPKPRSEEASGKANASSSVSSPVDRVEISEMGQLLSTIDPGTDIRIDKVMEIREALANGTYDIESKLETTIDRLMDELRPPV